MRKSTIAIVLLLMLAIPFQGFAAAMRSGCALGHHRATLHHQDGHADHAATHGQDADTASAYTDSNTSAATECECSTCGLGTGLPVSRAHTTLTLPAAAPLGRFVHLPVLMITGGPERPPRNTLA
jgi:hypothetical protein